jgi:DNA-directed RNA polymerase specialized sigma subunit
VREIYFRDCTAYTAAQKLRLSPGRVSKIRQSALRKMRGFMDR